MAKATLNAKNRTLVGTGKSKQMRASGQVPGILYGGHMEVQPIVLDKSEAEKFVQSHNVGAKVFVQLEGKEVMALLKDVQRNVFGNSLLHMDLQALTAGENVKLAVHLNFTGKEQLSPDSIAQELLHELEIETTPQYMMDSIDVDVSKLTFGDTLKVADLPIMQDPNIKVLSDPETALFTLVAKSVYKEEPKEGEEAPLFAPPSSKTEEKTAE
ncbi:50S ribosomal protein L25 [Anaerotalea alkaliphila]|uniref:Large ribosomal subunit protein bL25 n=1 Tax=Anaerotalea alkaliphila TaxID=2662126 RepID=A0A7X5HY56_9FIRM|nr:50S ribosomal protein L25 [Anaerotalea alkaliphila]NDL68770.1 50S ribosomal protein L25 [Anaerotalea alkaliphila]